MSYEDGWAAVNLEMPPRVPHVEFDAETHWELVSTVTGIQVNAHSPDEIRRGATRAFMIAWNYDISLSHDLCFEALDARRTRMGHAEYMAGGVDFDARIECPFDSPEDALALDPWKEYGTRDKAQLIEMFNNGFRSRCEWMPHVVNMTGTYVTIFSGLIAVFGWEMLLTAGGLDPEGMGEVANRYASWMQQFYNALAECESPLIYSHDDIVWTRGPVFHPDWYRKYIFPNYRKLYAPAIEAGKKVIFVSDGNYNEFIDDIAATGAAGFFFEPLTDLRHIVEHYGKTHIIVGNADTHVLLSGTKQQIRAEVERCMTLGRNCPGYFMSVTNMIPYNTPVENALYYYQCYEELSRR